MRFVTGLVVIIRSDILIDSVYMNITGLVIVNKNDDTDQILRPFKRL